MPRAQSSMGHKCLVGLCRDIGTANGDCIVLECGCLNESAVYTLENVLFDFFYAVFSFPLPAWSVQ